jgi:hypothetical protein
MNPEPDQNRDLHRALDESHPGDFVATSLAHTLAAVRARRRRKQATTLVGTLCLVAVVVWLVHGPMKPDVGNVAGAPEAPAAREAMPRIVLREITDAELLALFPGQTAGFATVNGQREFILLPAESAD